VKPLVAISIIFLLFLSVFVFPLDSFGSSVFYLSLCFFAVSLFIASWKGGMARGLQYLWMAPKKKEIPALLAQSAVLFAACAVLTVSITGICYALGMLDTQNVYDKVVMLPVPALIAAFTIAPLAEEALFRGLLFRKIGEWLSGKKAGWMPWAAAALASSIIFSLMHASYGSIAELLVAFAIGLALCIGTKKFNSLVPAVLAHTAFNFVSVVMAVFL